MREKQYQSKISVSHKDLASLKRDLARFLVSHKHVYCRALKRKVSMNKMPDAIVKRTKSARSRLQCFDVAIDILKKCRYFKTHISTKGEKGFEIEGLSAEGKRVVIHLREELDKDKNRRLYFISCY